MRIDIWSDIVCPWCYIGRQHLRRALESYDGDVEVTHHAFELDPTSPRDSTTPTVRRLASKYGMSEDQARATQQQTTARAADAGLTFNLDGQRSGNTRDAHRLVQFAHTRGLQDNMVERLYRAYFSEGRSIFDHESLAALAAEVGGMGADDVTAALQGGAFEQQVIADEKQAYTLGISGVPFFVIDRRYGLSGAQPPELLLEVLERTARETVSP